jgi:putative endonuclease
MSFKNIPNSIDWLYDISMARNQRIGKWGEDLAENFLIAKGLLVIDRNVFTPYGELDIVARQDDTIVFVEVKARTSMSFGFPETALNARKKAHLVDAASYYMQQHLDLEGDWRVDVIAIRGNPSNPTPEIEWFENALA